ncbi:MAG: hypothetical protein OXG81_13725 [Acidobacteria bacterium]|nr:hypothetical protein [Acidobacteriota bacterium]
MRWPEPVHASREPQLELPRFSLQAEEVFLAFSTSRCALRALPLGLRSPASAAQERAVLGVSYLLGP